MKIMYLVYSFTTGGTERLLVDICNEMVKRDNEVFLYIVNDLYDNKMIELIDENVTIELQKRSVGEKNLFNTMKKITKFVKENKIDIVHCNSLNSPELLLLTKITQPKVKIFYTIHGINQYKTLNKLRVLYRNIICNKIIAISNSVKSDLISNGAIKDKIIMIYNGLKTERFKLNDKKINKEQPVIGNISRIDPEIKGQDVLIDAIIQLKQKYNNIKCILAGGIATNKENDYEKLIQKIKENNGEENITFLGNIDNTPEFLKTMDIFVLPSRYEGFGLSLVEAMSSGIPCVASNIAGPAEIIKQEGIGKLFECGNAKSLAKAIQETIENYENIKKEATTKSNEIKQKYDILETCNNLLNIYEEG